MKRRMKKFTGIITALMLIIVMIPSAAFAAGEVDINETNFPDENFRNYVNWFIDKDNNGRLSAKETDAVVSLHPWVIDAADLTGIEYFTELVELNCQGCGISKLDLSKNVKLDALDCSGNKLTELDLSSNTELLDLNCRDNQLTELDTGGNTKLMNLYCGNNRLTKLDVSGNKELRLLDCIENQISELNLAGDEELLELDCSKNQIEELDVSGNKKLTGLSCSENKLTSADVSGNTALKTFTCLNNYIADLDVSKNTDLKLLCCDNNNLEELDVSHNQKLKTLTFAGNSNLSSINVKNNPELVQLNAGKCNLTELDISNNPKLIIVGFNGNHLTNFDFCGCAVSVLLVDDNEYTIPGDSVDLTTLPGNFKPENASDWTGGTVNGNIFTFDDGVDKATYMYYCGDIQGHPDYKVKFALRRGGTGIPVIGGGTDSPSEPEKPGKPGQPETGVKTTEAPRTGDENNVSLWVMLLAGSLLCAGAAVRKKERR